MQQLRKTHILIFLLRLHDLYAEDLQTQILTAFATIVRRAQDIQTDHLDTLKSRISATEEAFRGLNPAEDQTLFIEYNVSHFAEPPIGPSRPVRHITTR